MYSADHSVLTSHVLVLNKHYAAVRVVSARRAFCMLFKQIAEIVSFEDSAYQSYDFESWREVSEYRAKYEREHHEWVHCVRFELAVPKIIRLLLYDRLPRRTVKLNRRNIFARDRSHCQYCDKKCPTSELSLDHVVPRSRGGSTAWTNLTPIPFKNAGRSISLLISSSTAPGWLCCPVIPMVRLSNIMTVMLELV